MMGLLIVIPGLLIAHHWIGLYYPFTQQSIQQLASHPCLTLLLLEFSLNPVTAGTGLLVSVKPHPANAQNR